MMPRRPSVGAGPGFTLLEMMLAVAVLGLMLAMLSSSFSTVAHSKVHAEDRLVTDHTGRALLFQIANEIRGMVQTPQTPSRVYLLGIGHMQGGEPLDTISMSTLDYGHRRSFTSFGAEEIVTYAAVPNPEHRGWFVLERYEQSGLVQYANPATGPGTVLATNLLSLHIRYFNGQMWSESWDSASVPAGIQLPAAVTIDLQLAAPNGRVMNFTTEVSVPMAMGAL
jgi:prepilin-type N-terminal cleavage/methylation domain-containing protein